jgi:hypothetical protein
LTPSFTPFPKMLSGIKTEQEIPLKTMNSLSSIASSTYSERRHSASTSMSDLLTTQVQHLFLQGNNWASRAKLQEFFGVPAMGKKLIRRNMPGKLLSLDKAQRFFGEEINGSSAVVGPASSLSCTSKDDLLSPNLYPSSNFLSPLRSIREPNSRRHSDSTLGYPDYPEYPNLT